MKTYNIHTVAKSSCLSALLSVTVLFGSCHDPIIENTVQREQTAKEKAYNDCFHEIVGDFDPNHTWSTAQQTGIQVNISKPGTHVVRIYTANPETTKIAPLLGTFEIEGGSTTALNVCMPMGTSSLYAVLGYGEERQGKEFNVENGNGTIEFAGTRAGEDISVYSSWELVKFPGRTNDLQGCNDEDQPYNWENGWDNYIVPNFQLKYVENKEVHEYWPEDRVYNYTGFAGFDQNGNFDHVIQKITDMDASPEYISDGKPTVLCILGQNSDAGKSFGVYYYDEYGTKQELGAVNIDFFAWGNGHSNSNGQQKIQTGDMANPNKNCGKVWGYKFILPEGTRYGVYVWTENEILFSGESTKENIFAIAGKFAVPEDNDRVHDFISFETDGRDNNVSDVTFAFIPYEGSSEDPAKEVDSLLPWIIACEDMGGMTSDFDFNDIIFEVKLNQKINSTDVYIRPIAAGGTLEAYIYYKAANGEWKPASATVDGNELSEVHKWVSSNPYASPSAMLNTENGTRKVELKTIKYARLDDIDQSINMARFSEYFGIKVKMNGQTLESTPILENYDGDAPRMFCLNGIPKWRWMKECCSIVKAYDFGKWAIDPANSSIWRFAPDASVDIVSLNLIYSDDNFNYEDERPAPGPDNNDNNGGESGGVIGGGSQSGQDNNGENNDYQDDNTAGTELHTNSNMWSGEFPFENSNDKIYLKGFGYVNVGDKIRVHFTPSNESWSIKVVAKAGNNSDWRTYEAGNSNTNGYVDYEITSSNVNALSDYYNAELVISGKNATCTKVEYLDKPVSFETEGTVIWSGSLRENNNVEIPVSYISSLSGAKSGDKIRFYFSALSDNTSMRISGNSGWYAATSSSKKDIVEFDFEINDNVLYNIKSETGLKFNGNDYVVRAITLIAAPEQEIVEPEQNEDPETLTPGTETTLWEGEVYADNWQDPKPYLLSDGGAELINNGAKTGSVVRFYITPTEQDWWAMQVHNGHWEGQYTNHDKNNYDLAAHNGAIELILTQDIINAIKITKGWGGSFVIQGDNIKCTKVTLTNPQ